jgi:hypothetical protein
MKITHLAALLWFSQYMSDGIQPFAPFEENGIGQVLTNFFDWTDSAKERNEWRKIARQMMRQAKLDRIPLRLRAAASKVPPMFGRTIGVSKDTIYVYGETAQCFDVSRTRSLGSRSSNKSSAKAELNRYEKISHRPRTTGLWQNASRKRDRRTPWPHENPRRLVSWLVRAYSNGRYAYPHKRPPSRYRPQGHDLRVRDGGHASRNSIQTKGYVKTQPSRTM